MARYEFTKAEFGEKIKMALSFDKSAKSTFGYDIAEVEIDKLFEDFAIKTDPSAERAGSPHKYLHWICETYCKKPVPAEDFYRLHNDLRDFETWSDTLANDGVANQISQYENYKALQEAIRPYQQKRDARNAERRRRQMDDEKRQEIMAATTVVYDGPEGKVVIPHTVAASQHWGDQTRWCISALNGNAFKGYNKKHTVFIYIPNPTEDDKAAEPEYRSFKFAAVGEDVYNEQDRRNNRSYPDCVQKLAKAASESLSGPSQDYFNKHGLVENILSTSTTPVIPALTPAHAEVKPKKRKYSVWDESTHDPVYEPIMKKLSYLFEGSDDDFDEGKEALKDRPDLLADRNFVLYALQHRPSWIEHLSEEYRDDPEIVLAALDDWSAFKHASDRLKDDKDFFLKAYSVSENIYRFASKGIRSDRDIAMMVLRDKGSELQYVYPEYGWNENTLSDTFRIAASKILFSQPDLHDDRELVEVAVRQNSTALKYASTRLRNERDLCMLAGIWRFQDFGPKLRGDRELVRQAVEDDSRHFEYAARSLRRDKNFILEMVDISPYVLQFVPKNYKKDRDFMLEAVKRDGAAFAFATKQSWSSFEYLYANDREMVMAAVCSDGSMLEHASKELRRDRDICVAAVTSNPKALRYVPKMLQADEEILRIAMKQDLSACRWLDPRYNPDGMFGKNPDDYKHPLQSDKEFVLEAINFNPLNFAYAAPALRVNYDLNMSVIKADVSMIGSVHPDYFKDPQFMSEAIEYYHERGQADPLMHFLRHMDSLWGNIGNFCDAEKALESLKDVPRVPRPQPPYESFGRRGGGITVVF